MKPEERARLSRPPPLLCPQFPLGCLQFSGSPGRSSELRLVSRRSIESIQSGDRVLTICKKKRNHREENMFFTGRQRIKKSQSGCHHAGLAFPLLLPRLFPFAASCKLALFPHFLQHGSLPPLPLRLPAVSFPVSACASPVILTRIRLRALFIYSVYVN